MRDDIIIRLETPKDYKDILYMTCIIMRKIQLLP